MAHLNTQVVECRLVVACGAGPTSHREGCRELLDHLLLLAYDLRVVRDDAAQRLHAVVGALQAHGDLAVAPPARHRHVWAVLFEMIAELVSAAEQFPPGHGSARALAVLLLSIGRHD